MKASAGLVSRIVEFSAGMKGRKYQPGRGHAFLVHSHRNTTAVIVHCGRAVRLQRYLDPVTVTGQMFIHRVIHDLIDQMVQSFSGNAADIHARAFSHRLQAFQDRDAAGVVSGRLCHSYFLSLSKNKHQNILSYFQKIAITI